MIIDEVIQIQISSRKGRLQRRIDELIGKLNNGDTLIVTEITKYPRLEVEGFG